MRSTKFRGTKLMVAESEDSAVSKRGYLMGQFSKFIRPCHGLHQGHPGRGDGGSKSMSADAVVPLTGNSATVTLDAQSVTTFVSN